ncbi:MAG TPA: hypothetical protein VGF94_18035 [Kofleriaceae bacterium]|jgi:hypothetical protein
MRRALLIAIVLAAAPRLASADADGPFDYHLHLCDDCGLAGSPTRGYSPVWVEAGVAMLHFVPATTNQALDVIGGQARVLARNGRYHVGFEFAFADLAATMPMMSAARETTPGGMTSPIGGDITQSKLLIGTRADLGPVTLIGEAASGVQIAMYDNLARPPSQFWLLMEAHAQANVWLTPQVTLGALAGIDVLDPSVAQLSVVVGYHLRAFDGTR